MRRFSMLVTVIMSLGLSGCSSLAPVKEAPAPSSSRLVLLLVGGNSEAMFKNGVWKLYKGKQNFSESHFFQTIAIPAGLTEEQIIPYYFSWTGDDESRHDTIFPGYRNWRTAGSDYIETGLTEVLKVLPPTTKIAIVGWSNGGATAYELTCRLSRNRRVDLLVTLDPVSHTTRPCAFYSDSKLQTPAPWVNVYTKSSKLNKLRFGNVIALFGHAWDDDKLPSAPSSKPHLHKGNHGDVKDMWDKYVTTDPAFRRFLASLAD